MSDELMTDAVQEPPPDLGWWTISGKALLEMLRRVKAGEDPDLVYAEAYANSKRENHADG